MFLNHVKISNFGRQPSTIEWKIMELTDKLEDQMQYCFTTKPKGAVDNFDKMISSYSSQSKDASNRPMKVFLCI